MRRFRVLCSFVFCVLLLCGYAGAATFVGPSRETTFFDPDKEELATLTPEIHAVISRFSSLFSEKDGRFYQIPEHLYRNDTSFGENWVDSLWSYKVYVGLDEGFLLQEEMIVRLDGGRFRLNTADAPYVWVLPFYNRTGTLTIVLQKGALAGGLNAFGGPLSGEQLAKLAENPDAWIIGAVRYGPRDTFYQTVSEDSGGLSPENFSQTKTLYLALPTLEKMAVAALTPEGDKFMLLRNPAQWGIWDAAWGQFQTMEDVQTLLRNPVAAAVLQWPEDLSGSREHTARRVAVAGLLGLAAGIGVIALVQGLRKGRPAGL